MAGKEVCYHECILTLRFPSYKVLLPALQECLAEVHPEAFEAFVGYCEWHSIQSAPCCGLRNSLGYKDVVDIPFGLLEDFRKICKVFNEEGLYEQARYEWERFKRKRQR